MGEMVERVAEAISKADSEWEHELGPQTMRWSETLARAAIGEMLEPTDAMLAAIEWDGTGSERDVDRRRYQAMIAAAFS